MNHTLNHPWSSQQLALLVLVFFTLIVLADATLEITDDIYFDELYDQADTWRRQVIDDYNWRAPANEEPQARIEWGEDYDDSRYLENLNATERALNDPEPATILRLEF